MFILQFSDNFSISRSEPLSTALAATFNLVSFLHNDYSEARTTRCSTTATPKSPLLQKKQCYLPPRVVVITRRFNIKCHLKFRASVSSIASTSKLSITAPPYVPLVSTQQFVHSNESEGHVHSTSIPGARNIMNSPYQVRNLT